MTAASIGIIARSHPGPLASFREVRPDNFPVPAVLTRLFIHCCLLAFLGGSLQGEPGIRIGLIGLDSSHCLRFTELFNDPDHPDHVAGGRVVAAYAGGSADVELSHTRVAGFTAQLRDQYGIPILETIAEVSARSDALMILSVDGRAHLAEARAGFRRSQPVFIDKPLAGSLAGAIALVRHARATGTPIFSASALRYSAAVQQVLATDLGELRAAISYGPAPIEPHVPDFFFYGIHPTEALFTVLGPGCEMVTRIHAEDTDVIAATWSGGRTGVIYGLRGVKRGYGLTAFGTTAVVEEHPTVDFRSLAQTVMTFLRTGEPPLTVETTLEILAFMEAADESKRRGGNPVRIEEVFANHRAASLDL